MYNMYNTDTNKQLFYPLNDDSKIGSVALSIGTILFRILRLIFLLGHFGLLAYCCYLQENFNTLEIFDSLSGTRCENCVESIKV